MWIAHYEDGTSLSQVDKEGNEFQFKHIRQDQLEKFDLVIDKKVYSVNLKLGELNLSGLNLAFEESKLGLHRLIYFRRIRQTIGTAGTGKPDADEYFGFQTNFQGNNIKRLFCLKSNGKLIQE